MKDTDKTDELESEELDTAVDDVDEEGEDTRSDGQLLYEVLKKRQLVDNGEWDSLPKFQRSGWEQYALDSSIGDIREEMIDELS